MVSICASTVAVVTEKLVTKKLAVDVQTASLNGTAMAVTRIALWHAFLVSSREQGTTMAGSVCALTASVRVASTAVLSLYKTQWL